MLTCILVYCSQRAYPGFFLRGELQSTNKNTQTVEIVGVYIRCMLAWPLNSTCRIYVLRSVYMYTMRYIRVICNYASLKFTLKENLDDEKVNHSYTINLKVLKMQNMFICTCSSTNYMILYFYNSKIEIKILPNTYGI